MRERKIFENRLSSIKFEFLAFYGRRSVGKTFLICEYFDYKFDFYISGLANADMSQQLFNFYNAFNRQANRTLEAPSKNWLEGFECLKDNIELIRRDDKFIIFFDEVPWMDTAKSDFMTGPESF